MLTVCTAKYQGLCRYVSPVQWLERLRANRGSAERVPGSIFDGSSFGGAGGGRGFDLTLLGRRPDRVQSGGFFAAGAVSLAESMVCHSSRKAVAKVTTSGGRSAAKDFCGWPSATAEGDLGFLNEFQRKQKVARSFLDWILWTQKEIQVF